MAWAAGRASEGQAQCRLYVLDDFRPGAKDERADQSAQARTQQAARQQRSTGFDGFSLGPTEGRAAD